MDNVLKRISCFLTLGLVFIFSSCSFVEHVNVKDINNNATLMMECVVNRDAEGLFNFYSEAMRNNYADESLKEIKQLFDYIDGTIISYNYKGKGGGVESIEKGKIDYYSCHPEFDFTTDTGRTYTISFSYMYIWDEFPEGEGIDMLQICEDGDWGEKLVIGRIIEN